MLPSFLCIGAQKAGTSWLYAQLQSHPEVWMPPVKELQYFNHLYVPEHRAWTTWHIRQGAAKALGFHHARHEPPDFGYVRYLADLASTDLFTDDWYLRAFDRPAANGKLVGEITPEYSTIPEAGIRHLRGLLGAVKVIYLLREPLGRALSQLRMNAARHGLTGLSEAVGSSSPTSGTSRTAATTAPTCRAGRRTSRPATSCSCPTAGLPDPAGLLGEVEAFLGLAPHDYPRLGERVHATGRLSVPPRSSAVSPNGWRGRRRFSRRSSAPSSPS